MIAIEPSIESVDNRWKENTYEQIVGSIDELRKLDDDIIKWCDGLSILKVYGIRTFWDLQHNQEIENDAGWQEK